MRSARIGAARVVLCLIAMSVLVRPARGEAFTFPEHVRITQRAVRQLRDAVDIRQSAYLRLAELWRISHGLGVEQAALCDAVDASSGVVQSTPPSCVAFADLPALAGDHSCSPVDLERILAAAGRASSSEPDGPPSHWVFRVLASSQIADRLMQEEGGVPGDVRGRPVGARRRIRADLNLQLTLDDPDYVSRASENLSHFLPERGDAGSEFGPWLQDALCGVRGNGVCVGGSRGAGTRRGSNIVSTYAVYHLLALHLARTYVERCMKSSCGDAPTLAGRILRAEAFALHFLEDAFSAGHFVGAPLNSERRNGLHDHACEEGVDTRAWPRESAEYRAHGDGFMQPVDEERAAGAVAESLADLGATLRIRPSTDGDAGAPVDSAGEDPVPDDEVYAFEGYNSCRSDPDPGLRARLSTRLGTPNVSTELKCDGSVWRPLCGPLSRVPVPATAAQREASTEVSPRGLGLGFSAQVGTYWDPMRDTWAFQGLLAIGAALDADSVLSSYRDSLTLVQAIGGVDYRASTDLSWLIGVRLRLPFAWGIPVIGWLAWGIPVAVSTTEAPSWAWQRSAAATSFPRPLIGNPFPGRHLLSLVLGREFTVLWRFRVINGDSSRDGIEVQVPVVSMAFRGATAMTRLPVDFAVLDLGLRFASVASQGGFEFGITLSLGARLRYIPPGPDLDRR